MYITHLYVFIFEFQMQPFIEVTKESIVKPLNALLLWMRLVVVWIGMILRRWNEQK